MQGVDYAWWRPSGAGDLDGYDFICRYMSYDGSKNLSRSEADRLTGWGKLIVSNWESDGRGGGYSTGVAHAQTALQQATDAGMPRGYPIYFSVDIDVPASSQDNYLQGILSVLPASQVGVYGSAALVNHWRAQGVAYGWRTMSTDWRGGSDTSGASIVQTGYALNGNADRNYANASDFGGWQVGWPSKGQGPEPISASQQRAQHNTDTPVDVDGFFGTNTIKGLQFVLAVKDDGKFGPKSKRALQQLLGVTVDGNIGEETIKAFQRRVRDTPVDGQWNYWDPTVFQDTTVNLQASLNAGTFY